jgi:hypothetical protein
MRAGTPAAPVLLRRSGVRTATEEVPGLFVPRWRRAAPARRAKPEAARVWAFDGEAEIDVDPCAGWEIGACEVIRRLVPGEDGALLAVRRDGDGAALVVLERARGAVQSLISRAERLAAVDHPALVRVYPCEVYEDAVFWVSALAPGASLGELDAACQTQGMGVPLGLTLAAVYEAARALDPAQGVPLAGHFGRDQLCLTFQGAVKLACFGPTVAAPIEALGGAISPEVFSLGAVLYECVGGEALTRAPTPTEWVPPSRLNVALPRELDGVLERALVPRGVTHPRTPGDFARALKDRVGSFMWRESQRAEFVSRLFATRARRMRVLLNGLEAASAEHVIPRPPPLPKRSKKRADPVEMTRLLTFPAAWASRFRRSAPPARHRRSSSDRARLAALLVVLACELGVTRALDLVPGEDARSARTWTSATCRALWHEVRERVAGDLARPR